MLSKSHESNDVTSGGCVIVYWIICDVRATVILMQDVLGSVCLFVFSGTIGCQDDVLIT